MSDKQAEYKPVKIQEAIEILNHSVTDVLVFFEKLNHNDLARMLQAFYQLGIAHDQLNNIVKLLGELYDKYSYEIIPEVLETNGLDSVKTAGRNFILSTRIDASIPENMRDAGYKWLIEDAKCPELIIPRVNPKQLSAFVKAYFEANAKYPPEDAVKVSNRKYIQVRKA